jgi:predicted nucleic acid-binding protein
VVSEAIPDEDKTVRARSKFGLPAALRQQWYALLDTVTVIVDVPEPLSYPRDPTDAKFPTCAIAADAEWLITGDRDFSHTRKLVSTTILLISGHVPKTGLRAARVMFLGLPVRLVSLVSRSSNSTNHRRPNPQPRRKEMGSLRSLSGSAGRDVA